MELDVGVAGACRSQADLVGSLLRSRMQGVGVDEGGKGNDGAEL